MEEREVGGARRCSQHERAAGRELAFEQIELGAQLLALRRGIAQDPLERVAALDHLGAIIDEAVRKDRHRGADAAHRQREQLLLPGAEHQRQAVAAGRKQRRLRMQPVEHAGDQIGVAVARRRRPAAPASCGSRR